MSSRTPVHGRFSTHPLTSRSVMKQPPLWQISVTTSKQAEDAVAALLERLFGQPASVYTPSEGQCSVATVFSAKKSEKARSKREALQAGLDFIADNGLDPQPCSISIRKVARQDWSQSWKKYFRTIEIGSALLIRPSWDARKARPGQAVVVLDPGLSFGTGQHPTTAFCLRQIAAARKSKSQQSFLDIGSGSGLLAIAAAKLGYSPIRAFDSDPVAVRIAKANARRNRVSRRLNITRYDLNKLKVASRVRYDLICANLVDSLLIANARRIVHRLRPGGRLVLSGILDTQFEGVINAYKAQGLKLKSAQSRNGWKSGVFT